MPYFEGVDGTSLYYEDWGTGTPIVFVNTWSLGSGMWENQVPFLVENGMRCITYDRRGGHRSDCPSKGYDFDTLADDLAALLEHLDLREVVLAGHSMGGGEVTRYLARHGNEGRVAKAALLSALTPFVSWAEDNPTGFPPVAHDLIAATIKADRARYWAAWPGALFGTHLGNQISAETIDWLVREAMQTPMMPTLATWHSIFHTDFRADLRGITVPTLVVHGSADVNAVPDLTGRRTAELVPDCVYKEYEFAAHGLFVTHKDQLNADLLEFAKA